MTPPTLSRADPVAARSDAALRAGPPQAAHGGGFASHLQDRLSAPERPLPPPARQAENRPAVRPDTPRGSKPASSEGAGPSRPSTPADAARAAGTVRDGVRDDAEVSGSQDAQAQAESDAAPVMHEDAAEPGADAVTTDTSAPHASPLPVQAAPTPAADVVAWALQASRSARPAADAAHAGVAPAPDAELNPKVADPVDDLQIEGQTSHGAATRIPSLPVAAGGSNVANALTTAQMQELDDAGQKAQTQATGEAIDSSAGEHELHTMMAALAQRHTRPRETRSVDGSTGAERPMAALAGPAASTTTGASTPAVAHAHLPTPAAGPGFAGALAHQLTVWARDGVQRASLTLNPAELGAVTIKIAMDGSQARVEFAAATLHARDALQASLPTLAQMFSSSGLNLAGADVHARSSSGQGGEQGARGDHGPRRHGGGTADAPDGSLPSAPRSARRLGGLDLYA